MAQKPDLSSRAIHAYTLCGWHTLSDIPLTGVATSERGGEGVDILIQIARGHSPMAKRAGRVVFEHLSEYSLIKIADVADFEVREGRHIRVWPAAGATQKDIEIFLFGPAWATLCHQRGMLPLHASAILTNGGITAFAGYSGAGTSTIAALLGSLGYELVTDDILPISFNRDSVPEAWPYLRRLKLQRGPVDDLALTPRELVSERLDKEKYFVQPKCVAHDKGSRLKRLYLLETDSIIKHPSIERITGAEAVRILIDQTYHFHFILGSGRFRAHLLSCTQLASKIAIYRLLRPSIYCAAAELAPVISAHLENAEHDFDANRDF